MTDQDDEFDRVYAIAEEMMFIDLKDHVRRRMVAAPGTTPR